MRRLFLWWLFAFAVFSVRADVAVLTRHNDLARTGANLNEILLNTSNVNTNQFGLLYTRPVDDEIFAQPLIMTNVNLGAQGTHNIVIVATANNTVYAFDADDPSVTIPYWTDTFTNPPNIVTPTASDFGGCPFFPSHVGIIGTPVIDPATGTIYFVAMTKETGAGGTSIVQRLHALDVATGIERTNSPVLISATYPGTNNIDSTNGVIVFNPAVQLQRSGLALLNGTLYIAWASYCDFFNYHGWLMAYDAATLQQIAVFNDTPDGSEGGIWMAGDPPSADTNGNIYISAGNGSTQDGVDSGESFLKLTLSGTNFVTDSYFTPYDWSYLNGNDLDLGSAGILLIPGTSLAFSGGKGGTLYLVNKDNMGGESPNNTAAVQNFAVGADDEIYGGPVWWNGPNGSWVYFVANVVDFQTASMIQIEFNPATGMFNLSDHMNAPAGYFGIVAISSDGTNSGTGILWQSGQVTANETSPTSGILTACNAENISTELYSSQSNPSRDSVGDYATFSVPTVANGKVYLATFSNRLDVYGLRPPALTASVAYGDIVISWPANNYPNYVLQTSPDLLPGGWSAVTDSVTVTNGVFQVSVPISRGASFFRLKL